MVNIWRAIQQDEQFLLLFCGRGFHTVTFPVYVWEAIVAAEELDSIFQQLPMPSYHSFHFDAYYNSCAQTQGESHQTMHAFHLHQLPLKY